MRPLAALLALAAWLLRGGLDRAGAWRVDEVAALQRDGAGPAAAVARAGVSLLGPSEGSARAGFALAGLAAAALLALAVDRSHGRRAAAATLAAYATLPLVYTAARHALPVALAQALFTALFAASLALDGRARWAPRAAMAALAWAVGDGARAEVAASMESVGRLLFPWTGLAAVALAERRDDPRLAEALAVTAALFALIVLRGAPPALLAAPVAFALGLALDRGAPDRAVAWVVALVTVVTLRDLVTHPAPFFGPAAGDAPPAVKNLALAAGVACAPALALAAWGSRHARVAAVAGAFVAAALFSRGVERQWSLARSPTEALRAPHGPLALLAGADDDRAVHDPSVTVRFDDPGAAARWLAADARRALLTSPALLPALNRAWRARAGRNVAAAGAADFGWALATARPGRGPLDDVVTSAPAAADPVARFDDALVLDGVAVRAAPGPRLGSAYTLTHTLRVLRAVPGDARAFVHVDGPCARINADHAPGGRYPPALWLPGDRVRDVYEVAIPWYCPRGRYAVWTGFFRGDARLRVTAGAHDGDHRVRAATLDHPAR